MPYRIQIKLLQKLCYDIFVIFESPESAHPFHEYIYMSSKHQNIIFPVEHENIGSISFLDVKICCKSGKFLQKANI